MFKFITKWWNILIGKDKNRDGQVDIKDDMIRANKKAKEDERNDDNNSSSSSRTYILRNKIDNREFMGVMENYEDI